MGALRKAGVWLGLVEGRGRCGALRKRASSADEFAEDEDDFDATRGYAARPLTPPGRRARAERDRVADRTRATGARDATRATATARGPAHRPAHGPSRASERTDATERRDPAGPRAGSTRACRATRATPGAAPADRTRGRAARVGPARRPRPAGGSTSYPTQDNLALAPQVQLRERAVVSDDESAGATRSPPCTRPRTARRGRSASTSATAYPVIMNLTEMDEPTPSVWSTSRPAWRSACAVAWSG